MIVLQRFLSLWCGAETQESQLYSCFSQRALVQIPCQCWASTSWLCSWHCICCDPLFITPCEIIQDLYKWGTTGHTNRKLSVSCSCLVSLEVHTNIYASLPGSKHRTVIVKKLLAARICLALSSKQTYTLCLENKCAFFFFYVYLNQE